MKLKQITSLISERAGRQFDVPFQKEVEQMVHYWRAEFIRRTLNKDPSGRRFFLQAYRDTLKPASKQECGGIDCNISRTESTVPSPIRTTGPLFDYVGSVNGENAFGLVHTSYIQTMKYNRYTRKHPRYMYLNGYIFVINKADAQNIRIEGIFSDPTALASFSCTSGSSACYDENSEYPMPLDLAPLVINTILTNELKLPGQEEKEVDVKEK